MIDLPAPVKSVPEQAASLRDGAGGRFVSDRVIAIRGEDRAEWLAGMATNDTRSLTPGHGCYTAVVHAKGKLIADAWVFPRAEEILVVVPPECVDPLMEHFGNHIIMEDVEPAVLEGARVLAISGRQARAMFVPDGQHIFPADRLGWSGVDVVLTPGEATPPGVDEAIARGAVTPVDEPAWDIARLEAGTPRFGVDFGTDNYVQEANITARAVSFRKGCYTGQEVVCRLEMRGHVRRQLVALVIDSPAPAPRTSVGSDVGVVTSSAESAALGRAVALAMVKWDVANAGGTIEIAGRTATMVPRPIA